MIRITCILGSAALLMGGFFTGLSAQQEGEREGRRFSEEQRREFMQLSPEERRERARQWREAREGGETTPQRAQPEVPQEPAPEQYIDQLVFRSILTLDGVTQFSLHNPWENRTFWISQEQGRNGVEVVEFKADENTLTIRHEGETRDLALSSARVAELQEAPNARDSRRQAWEQRREELRELHEKWRSAVAESAELQELDQQFRELGGEFRQTIQAMRELPEDSPERQQLRAQLHEMREDFSLLSEYTVLQLQNNPNFNEQDVDSMQRLVRMMAARGDDSARGGWEGRRGRGGPGGGNR
jgi:hypothetical protein